jgi:prepilin-type N-terminal cleavage/methylation domain-containing protein/prepilin-type processing-associated H-X9-DG protein
MFEYTNVKAKCLNGRKAFISKGLQAGFSGAKQRRKGVTLIETLIVIGILGVLVGLVFAGVMRARESASRTQCANKLRQIALALQNYHSSFSRLPPGLKNGREAGPWAYMSWNCRLLPFLEQNNSWLIAVRAFEIDPDFVHNPPHVLLSTPMPPFNCPSDPIVGEVRKVDKHEFAYTSYLGVEGTNQFSRDGVLYLNSSVSYSDITDGLSNTLLVGERPPSADGLLGWWYAGIGQSNDGSAEMVLGVREQCLKYFEPVCLRGPYGFQNGSGNAVCDAFHFWSYHSGGANFAFSDSSVRFLAYSSDSLLPALSTRAGGEIATFE